jgi:hypothetical protein
LVPASADGFDQFDACGHLLHLEIHRYALIVQECGLSGDNVQIAVDA